jgi:hypothetical protein
MPRPAAIVSTSVRSPTNSKSTRWDSSLLDNQRLKALQAAVARLEAGKAFDAVTEATENLSRRSSELSPAKAELSRIFQIQAEQSLVDGSDVSKKISRSN